MGWEKQASSGGGGGGDAVTIADGADVTQGAVADAAWTGAGNSSVVAALKAIYGKLAGTLATSIASALPAGTNTIGGVTIVSSAVHTAAGTDSIAAYSDVLLAMYSGNLYPVTKAVVNITATGTILALSGGSKRIIVADNMNASAAVSWQYRSHVTTANVGPVWFTVAGGGYGFRNGRSLFESTTGEAIDIVQTGAGTISGEIWYITV